MLVTLICGRGVRLDEHQWSRSRFHARGRAGKVAVERGCLVVGLKKLLFRSQRFIDQPHGVDYGRRTRFGLAGLESFFIQANGPFP